MTTNFGGVDVMPLLGAIVVWYGWGGTLGEWTWCHCWVPLQGAIVGCHCSVLWLGGNFGGADVVPLLGAIAGCHCRVPL